MVRPDGKTPTEAQAIIDAALVTRTTFQMAKSALDLARGELEEARQASHLACVQVFPIMKSRFRSDSAARAPSRQAADLATNPSDNPR